MNRRSALGLLAASTALPLRARAAAPVRLAAPALDSTALMFYADEMGFFKKNGVDAQVQRLANGEAVTIALTGGAIDVGCSEVVSLILAFRKGIPITIIAPSGLQSPRSQVGMFFVRNGLAATSGKDLNGKTIAVVGLNGFAQYGTQNWLDKTGGDSRTCKFIQLAGAQIAVALQDGRVDAAFVPEPFVSAARKVARAIVNPMASIAPTFYSSAHFTSAAYAKAHPDEIRGIQSALRETAAWANANRDRSALILEKVAHVSPEIVAASSRSLYGDRLDSAELQPLLDVAAKYGGFAPFPASQMLYRA